MLDDFFDGTGVRAIGVVLLVIDKLVVERIVEATDVLFGSDMELSFPDLYDHGVGPFGREPIPLGRHIDELSQHKGFADTTVEPEVPLGELTEILVEVFVPVFSQLRNRSFFSHRELKFR